METYVIVHRDYITITGDNIFVEIENYQTALEQFEFRKNEMFDSENESLYLLKTIKRE